MDLVAVCAILLVAVFGLGVWAGTEIERWRNEREKEP